VDKTKFEQAVLRGVQADAKNGAKWQPLEELFETEHLTGSAARNNHKADRRTRARQLFTAKAGKPSPKNGVFVLADEAADALSESGHLDEFVMPTLLAVAAEAQVESIIVFRSDGKKVSPVLLLAVPTSAMAATYRNWYPSVREEPLPTVTVPPPLVFPEPPAAWSASTLKLNDGELKPPSKRQPLPLVGLDDAFWAAVAALQSGKHVVLFGPPGVGKTDLAEWICGQMLEDTGRFDCCTATSDWTTFDTIGGYVPNPAAGGQLDFSPGLVTRALEGQRWIIIDELNRADIDKAFGEMFTLLSGKTVQLPYRRRVGEAYKQVVLGASSDPEVSAIALPAAWRMLGTMNSFDKASLFQLSFAFMRRFAFINVPVPSEADYRALLNDRCSKASLPVAVTEAIEKVFASKEGLSSLGLQVGPAIPLDIIPFAAQFEVKSPPGLMTAFEAFLLPQFEGKDRLHPMVAKLLASLLGVDEELMSARLAVWTGYEPG
jgi:MoxR-like ATPase